MKARPILFKPDMVNAILEGRKTMTRRIVKPLAGAGWRPETANGDTLRLGMITSPHPKKGKFGLFMRREIHPGSGKYEHDLVPCPYGAPGDLLWVRETIRLLGGHHSVLAGNPQSGRDVAYAEYAADGAPVPLDAWPWEKNYLSSIHLPLGLSRLTLEITDVRVERLQDISEADARAEGIVDGGCLNCGEPEPCGCSDPQPDARDAFIHLWRSINGEESWSANPWVWVVEFQPHHMNVDAFLRGREAA